MGFFFHNLCYFISCETMVLKFSNTQTFHNNIEVIKMNLDSNNLQCVLVVELTNDVCCCNGAVNSPFFA